MRCHISKSESLISGCQSLSAYYLNVFYYKDIYTTKKQRVEPIVRLSSSWARQKEILFCVNISSDVICVLYR